MSYNAYITRIKNVKKHSNADRLQVGECFGNFVIVGLDTQDDELGIYFPTDGKLGIEYAEANNLVRKKNEQGENVGGYLDPDKRHITTIRLRKEKSDGLFMPLKSLETFCNIKDLKEGEMITTLSGVLICEKYVPRRKVSSISTPKDKKKKIDTITFPYFEEHRDTSQLAYNKQQFKEGDICYITLKMHGTSQRTGHTIKEEKRNLPGWIMKLFKLKDKITWDYITGTRRVVLKGFDSGFYGTNSFRQQWHDLFVGKLHKGEEVFYEVVGFTSENSLIMPSCDNSKTQDKEFIKQYGKTTEFTYGCEEGKSNIYVYRMTMTNVDGTVVEYPWELVKLRCEQMGVKYCPELDKFLFATEEDLMDRVERHTDGNDPVGKIHIREGVVVRIDNREKFTALKHKSFNFKLLEGIIKADDVLDMEEENNND